MNGGVTFSDMRIAVTGSTGLIGSALVSRLTADGHQVVRFTRSPGPRGSARWDPASGFIDAEALAGADGVVHLAGRSIVAPRWTARIRRQILDSRVAGTRLLSETMARLEGGPRVLVCASGMNWYGDRGEEVLTELSPGGEGFLPDVCRRWEAAAEPARAAGIRTVHVRTGMVQARQGGTLAILARLFRLGLGGRLGSGRQWWSWIALEDIIGIYLHALTTGVYGPLNGTAPDPVTNAEFTAVLARVLARPTLAPAPALALRLALGQVADELLLASMRVYPAAAQASGYAFRHTDLEPALRQILDRP
jgi:hypothetical protein